MKEKIINLVDGGYHHIRIEALPDGKVKWLFSRWGAIGSQGKTSRQCDGISCGSLEFSLGYLVDFEEHGVDQKHWKLPEEVKTFIVELGFTI